MHNIVLHISIYLFPWLHVLCYLSPINNARKQHSFLMGGLFNMCSYAHNASMKMTLRIMAVNTLTYTPT